MRFSRLFVSSGVLAIALALVPPVSAAPPHAMRSYTAHLTGDQEIPANDSTATGQLTAKLSKTGDSLEYKLIVANIENVTAAHFHQGPPTANGGVVAFLFGAVPAGGGRSDGVIAEGVITSASLVGAMAGKPLAALLAKIESGEVYANVHTNDGVPPTNTGPGDIPGGEIRGHVTQHGP